MAFTPPADAVRRCLHSTTMITSHWPYPIYSTNPTTILKSKFQGHATFCPPTIAQPGSDDLTVILESLARGHPSIKRASHCMYAWRICPSNTHTTRNISSRSQPPSSNVHTSILSGCDDGNESGAGERLSRLLELGGYDNVIILVHRWYGGVKLGSDRWKCISGAAKEALELGGFQRGGGKSLPSSIPNSEKPVIRNKKRPKP